MKIVYTAEVERVLTELKPDITVVLLASPVLTWVAQS